MRRGESQVGVYGVAQDRRRGQSRLPLACQAHPRQGWRSVLACGSWPREAPEAPGVRGCKLGLQLSTGGDVVVNMVKGGPPRFRISDLAAASRPAGSSFSLPRPLSNTSVGTGRWRSRWCLRGSTWLGLNGERRGSQGSIIGSMDGGCWSGCAGCYWPGLVRRGCRRDRDFSEKRVSH